MSVYSANQPRYPFICIPVTGYGLIRALHDRCSRSPDPAGLVVNTVSTDRRDLENEYASLHAIMKGAKQQASFALEFFRVLLFVCLFLSAVPRGLLTAAELSILGRNRHLPR